MKNETIGNRISTNKDYLYTTTKKTTTKNFYNPNVAEYVNLGGSSLPKRKFFLLSDEHCFLEQKKEMEERQTFIYCN